MELLPRGEPTIFDKGGHCTTDWSMLSTAAYDYYLQLLFVTCITTEQQSLAFI
jgi:hypothetical protein